MKILSIGLDKTILEKESSLSKRVIEYGELVEKYTVIVPFDKAMEINLNKKVNIYGSGGKNKLAQLIKIWLIIKKLFKENKYDIISVQDQYFLGLFALILKLKFKVGLEIQIHGFEKYAGIRKIIANFIIPRANSIRVVSERIKKQVASEFGAEENKIIVVPIFSSRIHNAERIIRGDNKIIFMYAGRFVEVKNLEMQIYAIKNLELRFKNVELWLVGDGELKGDLKNLSKKLGLENKIKFISWQDNLDEIYKKVDCFLMTSNYEGWGLSVIEAASYGLPIIMTDVGCAREVIKGFEHDAKNGLHADEISDESGIVIPIRSQKALEEAMLKLAGDVDLRKRLGKNAKKALEKLPNKNETLGLYIKSWKKAMR